MATKQLIAPIDKDLHEQFMDAVASAGDNMTIIFESWIRRYLEAKEDAIDVELFDKFAHEPAEIDLQDYLATRKRQKVAA